MKIFCVIGIAAVAVMLSGCGGGSQPQLMPSAPFQPTLSHDGSKVALWVTDFSKNQVLGLTADAKQTLISIDTATQKQYCSYPLGLKVDAHQNVWAACTDGNGTSGGALEEYNGAGKQVAQYTSGCPVNLGKNACKDGWSAPFTDGASGGKNACGVVEEFEAKSSATDYVYGTGFICWPLGKPSAGSTVTAVWSCTEPGGSCTGANNTVGSARAADLDPKGNIWFSYQGSNSSCSYGGGLGEVTNPRSPSATVTIVKSPCFLTYPGGIYISNHGTVLNAIDSDARVVYQFHLPVTASSTPFRTLGPTKTNGSGLGQPFLGGFNKSDSTMIISDQACWLDVGSVAGKKNSWSMLSNRSFCPGSAGYTPSDK